MLKITTDRDARRLVLAGSLAGPWVDTLLECWRAALTSHAARDIALDLSDVTFVDSRGKQLLGDIHQSGAALLAKGINSALIDDIVAVERQTDVRPKSSSSFLWFLATASNAAGDGSAGSGTLGPRVVNSSGDCP